MNNELSKQYTFFSLLKFSLPTILMMVFMSLYTMVDGIFVSQLIGTTALSALNIVYPLISVVIAIGIMLATGGSAIVAQKMGKGKMEEARQDFTLIVIVGAILGLIFTFIVLTFLDPILVFLGANNTLFDLCKEYAVVLILFTVPSILQMLFQIFFVTTGRPAIGLVVTTLGGISNIVLDYVFIAILGWGVTGAAIATGIGYSIPAIFGVCWFLLNRKGTLYFERPVWKGKMLIQAVFNGSSEMVTNISTAVITLMFNTLMMRYLGEDGVAAITIVLYAEFLLVAIYLGYSSGIAPIISYNYGEGNTSQLKRMFKISIIFLSTCSVITFIGAYIFVEPMVDIFAPKDSEVFKIAVHGYCLYAFSYFFKGINIYASSLFTSLSDGKTSAILSFLRSFVFIMVGMLVLPKFLLIDGVWLAVPFAETLCIILSAYYFRKLFKQKWAD